MNIMAKKAKVNKDACISCGLCVGSHPEAFDFDDDGKAKVIADDESAIDAAIADCPVGAIEKTK